MTKFFLFHPQVVGGGGFGFYFDGDTFDYLEAGFFESGQFLGVVRDDADFAEAEVEENLGALLVFAGVDLEAEFFVRLYRVGTMVLKGIGPYLVNDAYTASFLLLVNDGSAAFGLDHFHCLSQLWAAIAFDRAKNIACQTLRVNTDKRWHIRLQIAFIEHNELFIAGQRAIAGDLKISCRRREVCCCHFFYRDCPFFPGTIIIRIRQFAILQSLVFDDNYNSIGADLVF